MNKLRNFEISQEVLTKVQYFPYLLIVPASFLQGLVSLNVLFMLRMRHFYSPHCGDCAQLTCIALDHVIKRRVLTRLPLVKMFFP